MKKLNLSLIILSLLFSLPSFAQLSPKEISKLSDSKLRKEITMLAGKDDAWKSNATLWNLFQHFPFINFSLKNDFKKKPDFKTFINILGNPFVEKGLQNGFLYAWLSSNRDLDNLTVVLSGEKRAFANYYLQEGNRDHIKNALFFLSNLKNRETHYEKNRFSRFVSIVSMLSLKLNQAVHVAMKYNMPVLIELQSSVLDPQLSPILNPLAKKAISLASKSGKTPDGGVIVALHPDAASKLSIEFSHIYENLNLALIDFKKRSRDEAISDASKNLIEIIQTGKSLSTIQIPICASFFR